MKKFALPVLGFMIASLFSGCGLVEDAFKAGIIFTLIIIFIIGIIIWISRFVIKQLTKRSVLE